MGRPKSDYTVCPRCKRRTVLFFYGRDGEDYLKCVYQRGRTRCDWSVYRWADRYDNEDDRTQRAAWKAANPVEQGEP